jgi:hypothetical protein
VASQDPPAEVSLVRTAIREFFDRTDDAGRRIGSAPCGVYAFFDYDGEPIYVGQTVEGLSTRVGRHLTGRRSDAVGKFVLDPFEVLEIEVWPLPGAAELPRAERKTLVDQVEFAVFTRALAASQFGAVLNEGTIPEAPLIELPRSYRARIIPDPLYALRKHPDIRLARRAMTVASLSRLISERQVNQGLRTTLLVQCRRLEALARKRLDDFADVADELDFGDD